MEMILERFLELLRTHSITMEVVAFGAHSWMLLNYPLAGIVVPGGWRPVFLDVWYQRLMGSLEVSHFGDNFKWLGETGP